MADALEGIDLGEMVGILAQTEPQHSQATDDVFVDLNDIISNFMTDAERSALQGKRAWLAAEDEQLRLAVEKHGTGCWKRIARDILEHVGTERTTGMCRNRYLRITVPNEVKSKSRWHQVWTDLARPYMLCAGAQPSTFAPSEEGAGNPSRRAEHGAEAHCPRTVASRHVSE